MGTSKSLWASHRPRARKDGPGTPERRLHGSPSGARLRASAAGPERQFVFAVGLFALPLQCWVTRPKVPQEERLGSLRSRCHFLAGTRWSLGLMSDGGDVVPMETEGAGDGDGDTE